MNVCLPVSKTMVLVTDVNVRAETKGFWVCAGCSWVWIYLAFLCVCVCIREGCGECVEVSMSEKLEEGPLSLGV